MSTAVKTGAAATLPDLENGDQLTQAEFHELYSQYPETVKFELIGGIVFMASPLRRAHGKYHLELAIALGLYENETPGIEVLDNATTMLGEESEPQPDLSMRILAEFGGQSREDADDYVVGAPELVAEIAHSTRAIDMNLKRVDYQRAGVKEYIVLCVRERELHWFDFRARRPLKPDVQGVLRSRVFPGLWIDGPALLARKRDRVLEVIRQGLASREHAAFAKRMQDKRRGSR
jgi:Uma2 family endonuclease